MPWTTPTLKEVRTLTRDNVAAALRSVSLIGNSITRVLADAEAMLAHLVLLYLDWLAKQMLPDTAETEWLARHGAIWLRNSDSSRGRKTATYASGTVTLTGTEGTVVPAATPLRSPLGISYETTEAVTIGETATAVDVVALDAGSAGNLAAGEGIALDEIVSGLDSQATVVTLEGGADEESDDDLRERVLFRIQEPPMGGSAADYVRWTLAVPGVTRAWSFPNEMGYGTVTVRFMMDDLRAADGGFPTPDDIAAVRAYLDTVRPVCVLDFFVEAPIPEYYDVTVTALANDDSDTRAAIIASLQAMERGSVVTLADGRREWRDGRAKPGQTMHASWVSEAVSQAVGEDWHELSFASHTMPSPGHIPVLGTVTFPD